MKLATDEKNVPLALGLLILRLGFGGFLMTHGWGKVQMIVNGQLNAFGDPIGLGSPASLILTAFAEFLCALFVIVGFGTRWFAIPIVITMGVAAFVAHGADPWTMGEAAERFFSGASKSWASKQVPLMFLIPFLALVFTGAGRFSIDHMLGSRKGRRRRY